MPSKNEDEYFAKRDAELLKQTQEWERQVQDETERHSHYMKCPKTGHDLVTVTLHGVQVDTCQHCGGIWLDAGELGELLKHEEPGMLRKVFLDAVSALRGSRRESK